VRKKNTDIIKHRYNRISSVFNAMDKLTPKKLRKEFIQLAQGEVLEIGIDTGVNLEFYPEDVSVTGIDFSPKMLEKAITSSRIIESAKKEMMAKLDNEIDTLNIQLVELNHKHIMAFNYKGGLRLFMKQLKDINYYDAKEIFLSVVATDRENLNIILKLSNQSDLDIDYDTILKSNPIYTGSYEFIQTRLNLNINWKLFLT